MKKFILTLSLATTSFYCNAIDGHNGIKFSMNQQQLEKLGFICNSSESPKVTYLAKCKHMDMTGTVFSVPTRNYYVLIGKDKKVSSVGADLVGIRSFADYVELQTRISEFFPKKDEAQTFSHAGIGRRDAWRANNNAGVFLMFMSGIKGITNDNLSVIFHSPSFMIEADRVRAEEVAEKVRKQKESPSRENGEKQESNPE